MPFWRNTDDASIGIVGAGPAGLAIAYYLQKYGLPYRVLEKRAIGFSWQNHYDRLHLHTLKAVSALPGLPMPASYPRFPSAQQFQTYLADYAQHFALRVETGVEVVRADYAANGWHLQTTQGEQRCGVLVVATGIWNTPHRPTFVGQDQFAGPIIHVCDYRSPQPFVGQRMLVVGAGNSGAEVAVDLSAQGIETSIAVRSGVTFVPFPRSALAMRLLAWFFRQAPRPLGERFLRAVRRDFGSLGLPLPATPLVDAYPVVGYGLPEAVRAGRVRVYGGIERFIPGGVRFAAGHEAPFDTVILATGYRPTVDFVRHELELVAGWPRLQQGRAPRNPQLFCIGFDYPATEGWLQALGRMARTVVRQL